MSEQVFPCGCSIARSMFGSYDLLWVRYCPVHVHLRVHGRSLGEQADTLREVIRAQSLAPGITCTFCKQELTGSNTAPHAPSCPNLENPWPVGTLGWALAQLDFALTAFLRPLADWLEARLQRLLPERWREEGE